ncbi:sialic acid TRAP transporter substrate-binding protein SiaP [uncultured Cohaesibacter sp.]|uniref:sialic acid TRAP transporter substrate-binding protein SiaP n=1 Tax=uncultured Cohaesibacter sp. TaxID=1002546 RepID=UPI0029C72DED|nr:sialic acid TRAP transporter substrate-binding protein SiaP [uncultured Cohaesibacter sp.]
MLKKLLLGTVATCMMISSAYAARTITFGMQNNEASNLYKGVMQFNETLKEVSGGELSLKVFPGSQLGDFKSMVAQLQAGELDMALTGYPDMSYIIPELKLIGAPYVVSDYDHLMDLINGPFGQKMDEAFLKNNVKIIDVWYYGTRQTTSNRPINSLEDMKGLRLRTPNVPFLIAYAKNTGASPSPVAFQEVYLALQTNQVDGEENPLNTIEEMKFYEVQKYIALTNHFVASEAVQVSLKTWESLSEQEQGWLMEASAAGRKVNNDLTYKAEEDLIGKFKGLGITITEPDTGPFRDAMKPYYEELEAEFGEGSVTSLMK